MRAQLGFRKPGKDSIYNGKRTTRIIQIVRFKRPKSQRRTALEREKAIPHWSVASEFWFGSRKSWHLSENVARYRPHSGAAAMSSRHVTKFIILQSFQHLKSRAGQLSRDMGILLLASWSDYFCDLFKLAIWVWDCVPISLSQTRRSLAVCTMLYFTPETSERTA